MNMRSAFCASFVVLSVAFAADSSEKIPHGKDETKIVRVKADPSRFVNEDFVICGGVRISDYYNFAYSGATRTHYSIAFREVGATAADLEKERYYLYLSRDIGEPIAEHLIKLSEEHGDGAVMDLARVRVRLDSHRYFVDKEQWVGMLEVTDIQFITDDSKSWKPWYFEKQRLTAAALKEKKDKDDRAAAAALMSRIKANEKKQADDAAAAEAAKWRDFEYPKGTTFKAKYAGINSGKVRLIKEDGSAIRITLDSLSPDERDWITNKKWLKKKP